MNIRQRVVQTYVPGYKHEYKEYVNKNAGKWFAAEDYDWVDRSVYIDSKRSVEKIIEYLNPATKNWEPLPTVTENVEIPYKVITCKN